MNEPQQNESISQSQKVLKDCCYLKYQEVSQEV